MSAATFLRPAAGLRRLGHGRLRPARRAAAGKASGTEARDLGPGAAGGDRSRPGGIALGYRKVWARLRVCRDIRVARKRVLRLMRENNLLSPHRCRRPWRQSPCTVRSSLMPRTSCGAPMAFGCSRWTTAGAGSSPPEHWNAECVGWHVCKRGDRFAALQPISMGLAGLYGSTAAGAARGLALRMDRLPVSVGPRSSSDPAVLFVAERPTASPSGSIQLKEQIIHGRMQHRA